MNPKVLQYLMGYSDISVTLNTYLHTSFEQAEEKPNKMNGQGCNSVKVGHFLQLFYNFSRLKYASLCKIPEKSE